MGKAKTKIQLRLEDFKDKFAGETCYILGNGPTMSELNLKTLMKKKTFFVNNSYLIKNIYGIDFKPYFYFVSSKRSFRQYGKEYDAVVAKHKFYRQDVFEEHKLPPETAISFPFTHAAMDKGFFQPEAPHGLHRGYTVITDCIQMAWYMGFKKMCIGAMDINYQSPYFYEKDPTKAPSHPFPYDLVTKSILCCRNYFVENGRVLCKITSSPKLPLPYEKIKNINT